jgi:hypothetical protein
MTEEKRYFPQVYKEPFTPDLEVELDEQWCQMAALVMGIYKFVYIVSEHDGGEALFSASVQGTLHS